MTAATLSTGVADVLADDALRARVAAMQMRTRAAGGYQRAADTLVAFASSRARDSADQASHVVCHQRCSEEPDANGATAASPATGCNAWAASCVSEYR